MTAPAIVVGLNAVIVAVTDEEPRLLLVRRGEGALGHADGAVDADGAPLEALPAGPLDPTHDRTLDLALRGWVRRQTGIGLGYVEQLYTFGDRERDPRARQSGPRVLSIAYLALVREGRLEGAAGASWRGFYDFFPWEDWRDGRPAAIDREIAPRLYAWAEQAEDRAAVAARRERLEITFGLAGAAWDPVRVLERYELLWEADLVVEAGPEAAVMPAAAAPTLPRGGGSPRGGVGAVGGAAVAPGRAQAGRAQAGGGAIRSRSFGRPLALDHRRIAATALGRLRGKLAYRPVVFELLPATFTLLQLQRVVEALAGSPLHKQNFRRLVETAGLVEGTGRMERRTGGRPAELFCFRREVLRERPAPGVTIPGRGR